MGLFDTPLRAAALGVLAVAASVLVAGLVTRNSRWRSHALVLVCVALGMVLLSKVLQ